LARFRADGPTDRSATLQICRFPGYPTTRVLFQLTLPGFSFIKNLCSAACRHPLKALKVRLQTRLKDITDAGIRTASTIPPPEGFLTMPP
jgi:hypothetical protein